MGLKVTEVTLTTGYTEAVILQPGTTSVLIELPESAEDKVLHAFVDSIGGVSTGLTEGGASSAGDGWSLQFDSIPTEEIIVIHAKASAACDVIVSTWTK